ncbi:efflux RND transporter permease subunit, partial [Pseudomonas aeruginosa]
MSKFFIDRPIFAWVIALVIMLAGGLSILSLPVNQYPAIAPPAIAVQVSYPGASAETVQDTVVQVIEQQMNGIDNLRYISSESNSDGSMTKEDLSNYIVSNIQDPLSRTKGVGDFQVF